MYFTGHLFHSNNVAGSPALAEVCALQSTILVANAVALVGFCAYVTISALSQQVQLRIYYYYYNKCTDYSDASQSCRGNDAHSQIGPHIATATQSQIFYDLHYDLVSYLLPAKRWESVNGNGNGRKRIVKNGALHCIATVATVKG